MSRAASKSHNLALKAAAAIAAHDDDDGEDVVMEQPAPLPVEQPKVVEAVEPPSPAPPPAPAQKRPRGRPKNKRPVEARHTVYLDAPRHAALVRLAEDRGRSIHSLIIEGIDHVIGKPQSPGWMGR